MVWYSTFNRAFIEHVGSNPIGRTTIWVCTINGRWFEISQTGASSTLAVPTLSQKSERKFINMIC